MAGRAWAWPAAAIMLLGASAALVVWARTLPSFDAYGWLAWGQRTWHGGLDTNAAPSWKPLPYLFTTAYGGLGRHLELRLWMVTSAATALAGVALAARLAWRLTGAAGGRRWAAWVAAAFAGAALLGIRDELGYGYPHYALSSQTDPMIVAFVLAAIDLQLSGRRRTALGCWLLASFGRPEAWPFLALSSWWLLRPALPGLAGAGGGSVTRRRLVTDAGRRLLTSRRLVTGAGRPLITPRRLVTGAGRPLITPRRLVTGAGRRLLTPRRLVAGCWAVLAALWFGIPALTSRTPFVAAANALDSGRAPGGDRVTTVLSRFWGLQPWPVYVAAALSVAVAAWRIVRSQQVKRIVEFSPDGGPNSADLARGGGPFTRREPAGGTARDRATLGLAAGIVVWVAIEVAFGLHGWPALGRYMFEPAAVATVLAGAFAGRAVAGFRPGSARRPLAHPGHPARPRPVAAEPAGPTRPRALAALAGPTRPRALAAEPAGPTRPRALAAEPAGPTRPRALAVALAGPVLVAALVGGIVPAAVSSIAAERADLTEQHARTAEIEALPAVIDRLGGSARLRRCGEPLTRLQYQSALAYALGDNVSQIGFKYSQALAHGNPALFVTPFESGVGWQVQATHQSAPRCRTLPDRPANL